MDRIKLGSETAKGGFENERDIIEKFNNWEKDETAQTWLKKMGYDPQKIKLLTALSIPVRIKKADLEKYNISSEEDFYSLIKYKKADAQVKLVIKIDEIMYIENISIKKANSNADYNQIDKRPVLTYQEMWGFDDEIAKWLKLFSGEIRPSDSPELSSDEIREADKRLYFPEMPEYISKKIISFFEENKILIVSDILKGRGALSANWILVTKKEIFDNQLQWALCDINTAMNFWGQGVVKISPRGSLTIGKITLQRKGGTPDPTSLQFKFHPCDIFNS